MASTGWPKKVTHHQMIKNRIKSYYSLSVRSPPPKWPILCRVGR